MLRSHKKRNSALPPSTASVCLPFVCMLAFLLFSCAGSLQDKWEQLTPNEQSRIILNQIQKQFRTVWEQGELYVAVHPETRGVFEKSVRPSARILNEAIGRAIKLLAAGTLKPDYIYLEVQPFLNDLLKSLQEMGVKVNAKT